MIHLTVIIKHIKCYIPRNVGQMLSFWNNTLFYPCRCGSFPVLTEQPETCLERPKQGHKYPNYILSKMLILSTFIQDSQSLCVQWAKNKRKGLPFWGHMGSQAGRRVWWGPPAQKWCVLHKTTFPSPALPNTPAGIERVFENEKEAFLCCVCGFCYHIL